MPVVRIRSKEGCSRVDADPTATVAQLKQQVFWFWFRGVCVQPIYAFFFVCQVFDAAPSLFVGIENAQQFVLSTHPDGSGALGDEKKTLRALKIK